MRFVKRFFAKKAAGFYVSCVSLLLVLVAAVVYAASYSGTSYMSWWVLVVPIFAVAGFFALSLFSVTAPFSPVVLGVGCLTAFLLFIRHVYIYLSEVFYAGVTAEAFASIKPEFMSCAIFFFAALVLSVVGICLKQQKSAVQSESAVKEVRNEK